MREIKEGEYINGGSVSKVTKQGAVVSYVTEKGKRVHVKYGKSTLAKMRGERRP
jgi:hypothetical protein